MLANLKTRCAIGSLSNPLLSPTTLALYLSTDRIGSRREAWVCSQLKTQRAIGPPGSSGRKADSEGAA